MMSASPEEKLQVLVVDDDTETAVLCEGFGSDRHQFEFSDRAASGLERLHTSDSYDMVVVDFSLDEGTAFEFIAEAKKIRPNIPYLMWSVSSGDDIIATELPRLGLNTVLEAGIAGFAEKQEVLTSRDSMTAFLEEAAEYYRREVRDRVRPALLEAFKQLEVALGHTRNIMSSMELLSESTGSTTLEPLQFRLSRIESIVRGLLGYGWSSPEAATPLARRALEGVLDQHQQNEIADEIRACFKTLSSSEDLPARDAARRTLRAALEQASTSQDGQRAVATRTAEIIEFMIYSGEETSAAELSAELWNHANAGWELAPRISCGITHAYALASSGSRSLAEHLVAGILSEAEATFPEASYNELARSVFAELEQFSELAAAS